MRKTLLVRHSTFLRVAIIFTIILTYFGFSVPRKSTTDEKSGSGEYYSLLTDAFLSGRTSLLIQPDPRLLALPDPYDHNANFRYRLHDASLYNRKYYLYFGPTPCIILFLPYTALTKSHLSSRVAVPLFCAVGFVFSYLLFELLRKNARLVLPPWLGLAILVALGTGTFVYFLVRRPAFYETAISAGYAFLMIGFWALASFIAEGKRTRWLLASGLSFGLAAGCRPHLAIIAILMVAAFFWYQRGKISSTHAFAVPIIVCGLLLAAYNYVRFDNPLEFGLSYQVSSMPNRPGLHVVPSHVILALVKYLFVPPAFTIRFPYVRPIDVFPFVGYASMSKFADEPFVGMLPAVPLLILGLCTPLMLLRRRVTDTLSSDVRWLIWCFYASALTILATVSLTSWVLARYLVDLVPLLMLCTAFFLVLLCQNFQQFSVQMQILLRAGIWLCVGWTAYLAFAFALPKFLVG